MKAAGQNGDERMMKRQLDAHLRCADRNPRKREQHLNAARYYAQLLGVELPTASVTAETWVNGNSGAFFTATENVRRRCSLCGKYIPAGERYFGARKISVRLALSGLPYIRNGIAHRLHRACAESIK